MKVYTSYFARIKNKVNTISIANSCPQGFGGLICKALAPKWEWVAKYKRDSDFAYLADKYTAYLDSLGIEAVSKLIYDGAILCCWEANNKPCHRHVLAQWLRDHGIECEEYEEV